MQKAVSAFCLIEGINEQQLSSASTHKSKAHETGKDDAAVQLVPSRGVMECPPGNMTLCCQVDIRWKSPCMQVTHQLQLSLTRSACAVTGGSSPH